MPLMVSMGICTRPSDDGCHQQTGLGRPGLGLACVPEIHTAENLSGTSKNVKFCSHKTPFATSIIKVSPCASASELSQHE